MFKNYSKAVLLLALAVSLNSCEKDNEVTLDEGMDKLLIGTNITTSTPVIGYVGTLKDLTAGSFTNSKSRQFTEYPYVTLYKDFVYVMPHRFGDIVRKYRRESDGSLSEAGSFTAPPASAPMGMVIESDTKGYCSLYQLGEILVFNPATMEISSTIDLKSYGLLDGNPDPNIMALKDGKLYVACSQTSNGFTSSHPVQVLIIDLANGNTVTSVTDSRTTWAGSLNEQKSIFFDERGDMYIFCVASYGFGDPSEKSGYLRIKNGETSFDPTYFFNVTDYNIEGIPGNKVDYLQKMRHTSQGIVYSTGNIYALATNPPNYVTDRTYGSFKVDLYNQTITKLDLPYSNGYAASVAIYEDKVLFGLASTTGVGIYTYDPATNTASSAPVVTTQGDPHLIESF